MTPYESFHFFLYLLIPLGPAALFGLLKAPGRVRSTWLLLSTIGMLWLILKPRSALYEAGLFLICEWILVRGYLVLRTKGFKQAGLYYSVIGLSLLPLALVKFSPYLDISSFWHRPVGFLGISYVTFRIVGIIIEIRDSLIKDITFFDFFSFVLFFPTLTSGPIDRYRRFKQDLDKPLDRREYSSLAVEGLNHIFRGFLYKFIIAYLINSYWLHPLSGTFGFSATWNYMYAYSFYLFFDFAGYSAFAVGVSYLLGIKTPENFDKPFLAKNIKDFWNRWHITLSFWFRDFIYMRFVLFATKKKWFRNRSTVSYVGYLLLFLLMGIWHGTQLHFLVYGLFHAAMMIGYEVLDKQNKKYKFWRRGPVWDGFAIVITVQLVMFSFLIFSGRLF